VEGVIGTLLSRYENGTLTRRDLVRGLTMLAGGAATAAGVNAQPASFQIVNIDHAQINASNVRRSTEFYQKMLGLSVLRVGPASDPKCCPDESAFLGVGQELLLAIRKKDPAGQIDHFGFRIANFNEEAVTNVLQQRGVTPKKDAATGFYVQDPDGVKVQLSS
jgi:catechol 2,3-dioxygenase-like lactoylglutathione lyase family enzyme